MTGDRGNKGFCFPENPRRCLFLPYGVWVVTADCNLTGGHFGVGENIPAHFTRRSAIVNADSGIVNTHSGEWLKAFTFDQNQRSRSVRINVHVRPETAFTLLQNMQSEMELLFPISGIITPNVGIISLR